MKDTDFKILEDCTIPTGTEQQCGDGCCTWVEWNNEKYFAGDVITYRDWSHPFKSEDLFELVCQKKIAVV